jgi:hypothetical protein
MFLIPIIGIGQNKICEERGHLPGGFITKTLAYCPPYQIDYDDSTVMVYPACNSITYTCSRCGERVSEREKERRVLIWKKKSHLIKGEYETPDSSFHIDTDCLSDSSRYAGKLSYSPLDYVISYDKEQFIINILELWEEYETYCKNDSSNIYIISQSVASDSIWYKIIYSSIIPTLEGFMKYLKLKNK